MKKLISVFLVLAFAMLPCIAFACECECTCSNCTCYVEEPTISPILLRTTGNVNIRQYADINSKSVGSLNKGVTFESDTFYATTDGRVWARIYDEYGYIRGYVSMKYWECIDGTEIPDLAYYMTVTGESVHVREWASINADVCAIAHENDVFVADYYTHTSDGRIWATCFSETYDEFIGYISCKYLEPASK